MDTFRQESWRERLLRKRKMYGKCTQVVFVLPRVCFFRKWPIHKMWRRYTEATRKKNRSLNEAVKKKKNENTRVIDKKKKTKSLTACNRKYPRLYRHINWNRGTRNVRVYVTQKREEINIRTSRAIYATHLYPYRFEHCPLWSSYLNITKKRERKTKHFLSFRELFFFLPKFPVRLT